jgi:formylmethanofuran dehydrogenase subunit D
LQALIILYNTIMNKNDEELFVLISGRSTRQGTSLNESKFSKEYIEETGVVQICPEDMARLGLVAGDIVCLRADQRSINIPCVASKEKELPSGLLFMAYGDWSSRLMGSDTHGTGMPNSKGTDVFLSKVCSSKTD